MFWNLTTAALVAIAGIILVWLWPRVTAALRRFDAQNRDRIEGEIRDRWDATAHFRHTIKLAEEQVDEIIESQETDPRTSTPVTRYVFEGVTYASRDEAEKVRAEKIGDIARGFYRDLPGALAARKRDGRLN